MQQPVIQTFQLGKTYKHAPKPSLSDVSLSLFQGEKFGVFGPNGAGKTTLISILCGLLKSTTGEVQYTIDGSVQPVSSILDKIGYVPQDFAFYAELTPYQNLIFFGKMYNTPTEQLQNRIMSIAETLGLDSVLHKKINTFSGGMKRRVNLAIGIINHPSILFLDEPTTGIDVQSKLIVTSLLQELNKQGTTIVYTSHHLKEAEVFCDRLAILNQGEMIAIDTLEALLNENQVNNLEELLVKLTKVELR